METWVCSPPLHLQTFRDEAVWQPPPFGAVSRLSSATLHLWTLENTKHLKTYLLTNYLIAPTSLSLFSPKGNNPMYLSTLVKLPWVSRKRYIHVRYCHRDTYKIIYSRVSPQMLYFCSMFSKQCLGVVASPWRQDGICTHFIYMNHVYHNYKSLV